MIRPHDNLLLAVAGPPKRTVSMVPYSNGGGPGGKLTAASPERKPLKTLLGVQN